ncbi:MAG: InlB B-repeat-containing protein, partial [Thermoplasmatota archaeon]
MNESSLGKLRVLGVLVISLMLIFSFAQIGTSSMINDSEEEAQPNSDPMLPNEFYGNLTINGEPGSVGTELVGRVIGEAPDEVNNLTTKEEGYYGDPDVSPPEYLTVSGDSDDVDKGIVFYMRLGDEWVPATDPAPGEIKFEDDDTVREVDLEFNEDVETGVNVTGPEKATEQDAGNHTYEFTVENEGTESDNYTLNISSTYEHFSVDAQDRIELAGGESKTVDVNVTIEQEAEEGTLANITLTATSEIYGEYVEDSHTMNLIYGPYFDVDVIEYNEEAIDELFVEYEIDNIGAVEDTQDIVFNVLDEEEQILYTDVEEDINLRTDDDPFSGEFTWNLTNEEDEQVDSGQYLFEISSDDDVENRSFHVGEQRRLKLNMTQGEGGIEVNGEEVDLPFEDFYAIGENVTLRALPDEGYEFIEWTGDYTGTEEQVNVTMDEDKNISAVFERSGFSLTVDIEGEGNIEVNNESVELPFEESYENGTVVDLGAIADEGYHFVEWTGDNGTIEDTTANQTTIEMQGDYSITAEFEINTYELTVDSTEGGEVVNPGEDTHEFDYGTVVDLEAIADEGYYFVEWTGDNGTIEDTTAN